MNEECGLQKVVDFYTDLAETYGHDTHAMLAYLDYLQRSTLVDQVYFFTSVSSLCLSLHRQFEQRLNSPLVSITWDTSAQYFIVERAFCPGIVSSTRFIKDLSCPHLTNNILDFLQTDWRGLLVDIPFSMTSSGEPLSPDLFSVNYGMNFGQLRGEQYIPYEVTIARKHAIELLQIDFNTARDEIRIDDAQCGETSEFSRCAYRDLSDAWNEAANYSDIADAIDTYIGRELFIKLIPLVPDHEPPKYVIDSIDKITIDERGMTIYGQAGVLPIKPADA